MAGNYRFFNQADCYSQEWQPNNNSNGVAGLGLVHYNGTHYHLDSFPAFRAVTAALETKGPPIDNHR
jgi:hypothetical protein